MKKFLKFYLPIFVAFLSLSILVFAYLFNDPPILARYMLGHGKLYSQTVDAVVKINGKEVPEAKVFKADNEKLFVYTPYGILSVPVIVVDKTKNDIGMIRADYENYELIFNRYLLQSESSYDVVYASDVKAKYDPDIQITESRISYNLCAYYGSKVNFEILLKGE
jgi:hypothetical protein